MTSVGSLSQFLYPRKKYVFSPLSLNAKLVGRLYECLAPAEGEVRGCISCAYLRVWFLLVHGYFKKLSFQLLLKTDCSCFGPALPSQNTVIGFTCSSHALCSEEHHFVLHPPLSKTFTVAFANQCVLSLYLPSPQPA